MNPIKRALGSEPALFMGLVHAVLSLVLAFGIGLSADQIAGINAVAAAFFALVVRQKVTPVGDTAGGD